MRFCLRYVRRVAQLLALGIASHLAFAANQPAFPVLKYERIDSFSPSGYYSIAFPVNAVAQGDLYGNGKLENVYAYGPSPMPGTASTLFTVFGLSSFISSVPNCTAVDLLLADLNKDGKADAVVTCKSTAAATTTVTNNGPFVVLTGNGAGKFTYAGTLEYYGRKVQAIDLNNDGYPELLYQSTPSDGTSDHLGILLNKATATPSFNALPDAGGYTLFPTGSPNGASGTGQFVVADINMDGKLDLLLGANDNILASSAAEVQYGNGDGTFQPATSVGTSLGVGTLAVADFDGDGKPDVASYAPTITGSAIVVQFPNASKPGVQTIVKSGVAAVQPMDINGDGKLDIVLLGPVTTILIGDGTGAFTVGGSYSAPGTFYTARQGAFGTDLVFTTPAGFYTLHNDGKGSFDGLRAFYFTDQPLIGDFNKDGVADIAGSQFLGMVLAPGTGDGSFSLAASDPAVARLVASPVAGDFNGDGVSDVVLLTPSSTIIQNPLSRTETTVIRVGLGSPSTSIPQTFTLVGSAPVSLMQGAVAGDFNGDGKLDLAISYDDEENSQSSGVVILPGTGDGGFASDSTLLSTIKVGTGSAGIISRPFAADLNGDGRLDIVWGNNAYLNKDGSAFTPVPLPASGTPLLLADINGDKLLDIVINNSVYAGKGDGSFNASPMSTIATPAGASFVTASLGDLNGDGHPDLVIQSMTTLATFTLAYGDGSGGFTTDTNQYTTGSVRPVTAAMARLNSQSPADNSRLDYVVFADGAAVPMLNGANSGVKPIFSSTIVLANSTGSAIAPLQPFSLYAQILGSSVTGNVTFTLSDGTVLGTGAVTSTAPYLVAIAGLNTKIPTAGTFQVIATYTGDAFNKSSVSQPVTITITKARPQLTLQGTAYPGYAGRSTSLSVSMTGSVLPTGTVTFTSNGQVIGTATPDSFGSATLKYTFASVGSYTIGASFAGDASNEPTTASPATLQIVPGPDFSISATSSTVTVKAGEKAVWYLTLTSQNNYSGYVTMGCQQDNCGTAQIYVSPTTPGQVSLSIQTTAKANQSPPGVTPKLTPIASAALLLFAVGRRRWRSLGPQIHIGLFAICALLGSLTLLGCSGGSSSSSTGTTTTTQPTTYSFVIVGSDPGYGIIHPYTLTLIIK